MRPHPRPAPGCDPPARRARLAGLSAALLGSALLAGCLGDPVGEPPPTTAAAPAPSSPALCTAQAATTGRVEDPDLDELSGLVSSRRHPGVLWAVEDSGADAEVVALDTGGRTLARVRLDGARNVDVEDLGWAPAASGGADLLYVADIGDNAARRSTITVYRLPEPDPAAGDVSVPVEAITLRYADGPRDAEALLVDRASGELVVLTKDLAGRADLYAVGEPAGPTDEALLLERRARLSFGLGSAVTAADLAGGEGAGGDGAGDAVLAVRTYPAVLVWARAPGEPLAAVLTREPCRLLRPGDGQAEALALDPAGTTAWMISEGDRPPVVALAGRTG